MLRLISCALAASLLAGPALAQLSGDGGVVYARQIMMSEIEAQMGPTDMAAAGEDFDLATARRGASAISAMLAVTPFVFPEGTDMDSSQSFDFPSIAMPAVWESPEAFLAMAEQGSQIAFDLSQINDEEAYRAAAPSLRAVCDACHQVYMQAYESPY